MKIIATRENMSEVMKEIQNKRGTVKATYIFNGKTIHGQTINVMTNYGNYIRGMSENKSNVGTLQSLEFNVDE